MKHWKRVIVLSAIAIMAFGAIAYAHGGWGWGYSPMMGMGMHGPMWGQAMRGGPGYAPCGGQGFRKQAIAGGWESAPEEIQARMKTLQRTRLELSLALTEEPVDTKKVTELHEKVLKLHSEMARWHFEQTLKGMTGKESSD